MTTETVYTEISTDALRAEFVKHLPAEMSKGSALVRLGAPAVAPNIDSFTRVTLGAPAAVAEGDVKPATAYTLKQDEVKKTTLTHIIMVTKQSLKTAEGQTHLQDLFRQASGHFARGADTVFTHGTNPVDGSVLPEFNGVALVKNSVQTVFDPATDKFDRVIDEVGLELEDASGLGLSRAGYTALGSIYTDSGVKKYPNATKNAAFELGDANVVVDRVFGEPAWDGSTSNILGVAGNYNNLLMGIGNITIEEARTGMIGDVNLFTTNRVAYLIEVEIGGVNLEPLGFATIKTATV